ncbi:hypothetical protein FH972_014911 [Carpinus fangiana]|uniref:X8 domain-containing protein n=1 Tax=Carpinus fangiana TaxID=176857 RepID=A0A5N6RDU7_9ROSI|nr:hypothetical protein FH972_014911 [Carpinus fangiana]
MASPPPPQKAVSLLWVTILVGVVGGSNSFVGVEGAYWCVARSDASEQALQTALDYACGTGGDCSPIQSNGLCYLPNTIQAHASYAFNSYFQRKAMAPGSCYGSCVYPSSLSTAGGTITPTTQTSNNPNVPTTPTTAGNGNGGTAGLNPGMNPPPFPDNSKEYSESMIATILLPLCFLIVLTLAI